jgi:hypothetical protein
VLGEVDWDAEDGALVVADDEALDRDLLVGQDGGGDLGSRRGLGGCLGDEGGGETGVIAERGLAERAEDGLAVVLAGGDATEDGHVWCE